MAPTLAPSDLVACAWIRSIPAFTAAVVDTQLPSGEDSWAIGGAVRVSVVGGAPSPYNAYRSVVVQADCYANEPDSDYPPWQVAQDLASQIYLGCLDRRGAQRIVSPQQGSADAPPVVAFPQVTVRTVHALIEPRRMPADAGDYAVYSIDLALAWSQDRQTIP